MNDKINKNVEGLENYLQCIKRANNNSKNYHIFYRGHKNKVSGSIKPPILREENNPDNEDVIFKELLRLHSNEFSSDFSTFDKLVRMQHYGLPTRLLDITSNPLIALYFACQPGEASKENTNDSVKEDIGEILILKVPDKLVKYPDSDTASCLANLSRLNSKERNEIKELVQRAKKDSKSAKSAKEVFNDTNIASYVRFLHYIKQEKSFFREEINPFDLEKIICIKAKSNNERIVAQSGAFLLFGISNGIYVMENEPDSCNDENDTGIKGNLLYVKGNKEKILTELEWLNINERTVFPDLEHSAAYINRRYKS